MTGDAPGRSRGRAGAVAVRVGVARTCLAGATAAIAVGVFAAAPAAPGVSFTEREQRMIRGLSPLPPVPADPTNRWADHPAAARLGQFLFFDPRLSIDGSRSCATCHDPRRGFGDARPLPEGRGPLPRHTMPLWNVGHNRWFFWDGRADTLWSQALEPIENPLEFAGDRLHLAHLVHDDPALRAAYTGIFGDLPPLDDEARFPPRGHPVPGPPDHPDHVAWMAMTAADRTAVDRVFTNVGKAIAAYERRLVTGSAPFDVFVEGLVGDDAAKRGVLSPAAQRGLKLFVGKANCRLCHLGPNLSDGEFHATGVAPRGGGPLDDAGRYDGVAILKKSPFTAAGVYSDDRAGPAAKQATSVVRSTETWGQFKTPTLRNVALTPPYMHQGQLATLEDVLDHYNTLADAVLPSHHQEQLLVPLGLDETEIADLAAFLRSLTGAPLDPALLRPPPTPGLAE